MSDRWRNNPWTEAAVETLKRLWEEGLSSAKIGAEIGVTRSAVIGKVHRLKLTPRGNPGTESRLGNRPRGRSREYIRKPKPVRNFGGVWGTYPDKEPEPFIPRAADIVPFDLTILEVCDTECKWPYGDGPITFCGHSVAPGKPYCASHCKIAYLKKTERTPAQKANDARMADRGRAVIKTRAPHKFMVEEVA